MKILVILMFTSQVLCDKPIYGPQAVNAVPVVRQVSNFDLLRPAQVNFGFNAGYQLPEFPSFNWKPVEVPVPVPDFAAVDIPYPYLAIRPRVNVRNEPVRLPIAAGYH